MYLGIMYLINYFAAGPCPKGSNGTFLGIPTWYKYLDSESIAGKCTPIVDITHHPEHVALIVLAIIEVLLRISGVVAVGFIIYGGFRYITSQGQPENTKAALSTIINAIIGVVIATIATVVVNFVARSIS